MDDLKERERPLFSGEAYVIADQGKHGHSASVDGENQVCFQRLSPKLKVLITAFKVLLILIY